MTTLQVEFSPAALTHVEQIQKWWFANRPKAPSLFVDELLAAIGRLSEAPLSGALYSDGRYRRLLMQRSRYHVYYAVSEQTVRIHAVWHVARGRGPAL